MNKREYFDRTLGVKYIEAEHESGLKILVCPRPEYRSAYALFGTKYGSIDTKFRTGGDAEFTTVPEGIAHFLEHKLFESEQGDVFSRYAETGAYANAYTSFDRTCYLFSCTSRFSENLAILLDFVQSPYFTAQSVEKEQGIIGQEIRMYDDDPQWRVLFNLLTALYENHPVRIDIAGTVESISHISDKLLYRCYETFYNLNNMFLCVAGNVDPDAVLAQAEQALKPAKPVEIERGTFDEPKGVVRDRVEQKLAVSMPLFCLGFKEACEKPQATLRERCETELLLEIVAGRASAFYQRLMDEGLINEQFETEFFTGNGYAAELFQGESKDPDRVAEQIKAELERLRAAGVAEADFTRAKNRLYGRSVMRYNNIEAVGSALVECAVNGFGLFEDTKLYSEITVQDINRRLQEAMRRETAALSVVLPADA